MAFKRLDPIAIRTLNVGARIFGGLACLVGAAFLLTACLLQADRIIYALIGVLCIAMGIAFWVVRPITQSQVDSIRERSGSDSGS
jgi:1,4-dihydroxy-2-naphthoate octaprenyltransferase